MTDLFTEDVEIDISEETILSRRHEFEEKQSSRVVFKVESLYGLADSIQLPLNKTEEINSGPIALSIDPASNSLDNVGVIDFEKKRLTVRYHAQLIFPALYDLVTKAKYDFALLNPIRVTATDRCSVTDDYKGWNAFGCLHFLPGSVWSGASGG